jgi:Uma2 family endonuclease
VMTKMEMLDLDQLLHDGAVKLEITGGIPTWEAFPGIRHQLAIDLIRASIEPVPSSTGKCEYFHVSDVLIHFRDGSLKRPDIAIFCSRPPIQDEALTQIPAAVVEVISPGYEYKDVTLNPEFYLAQDIDDVVVFDPRSGVVTHYRTTGTAIYQAPVTVALQCGCQCTIPSVQELG